MPAQLYQSEWERRKIRGHVHLTMGEGACLGPCSLANVVMLIFDGAPVWFQNMHTDAQVVALYDYIEAMISADAALPVPEFLRPFAFQAYTWHERSQPQTDEAIPVELNSAPQAVSIKSHIALLTQSDTDLLSLRRLQARLPKGFAPVRGWNADVLRERAALDRFVTSELNDTAIVIVRLLTMDEILLKELQVRCLEFGKALVVLSGMDMPDAALARYSTVTPAVVSDVLSYFRAGGVDNIANCLRFLSDHLLVTGFGYETPKLQPAQGIYHPALGDHVDIVQWRAYADPRVPVVGILFYRAHFLSGNTAFVDALVREIEQRGATALPVFVSAAKDVDLRALDAHGIADVFISTLSNSGLWRDDPVKTFDSCVVVQASLSSSTQSQWEASKRGLNARDTAQTIVLPEYDGVVIGAPIAFKQTESPSYAPSADRCARVVKLALRWAALRRKPNAQKRVAFVLTNSAAKAAKIGNAVGLDAPASLVRILEAMSARGYALGNWREEISHYTSDTANLADQPLSDVLMHTLIARGSYDKEYLADFQIEQSTARVTQDVYARWHSELTAQQIGQMDARWGAPPGKGYARDGTLFFSGLVFGNVFVGLQPPRGYGMDPQLIYHSPDLPPTHHYHAFYAWLARPQSEGGWGADAVVHLGKHGTLEWLNGKSLGLSQDCFPDAFIGDVPLLYPFIVNDPGEGMQAKRRAHAVIVDHLNPPLTNAELYDDLNELLQLVDEYYQIEATDPAKLPALQKQIWHLMKQAHLEDDLQRISDRQRALHGHEYDLRENDEGVPVQIVEMQGQDFAHMLEDMQTYLCELHSAQIRDGLHTLGVAPQGESLVALLFALTRLPNLGVPSMRESVARQLRVSLDDTRAMLDVDAQCKMLIRQSLTRTNGCTVADPVDASIRTALDFIDNTLVPVLGKTDTEVTNLLRGLDGLPIPPGPSGAPTRGNAHVLPTGRNFYSLDPRAVPSQLAWRVGEDLAQQTIERFRRETGAFPTTVGLTLWGTSAMRTQGDDVAQALALMGVRPIWQRDNRRVTGIEVIPLSTMRRPRVDVVMRISGMFRDAYPHLISLLDDAVKQVIAQDEPEDQNAVRARFFAERERLLQSGSSPGDATRRARYRIFSGKPGSYGAGLLPLIDEGNWRDLGDFTTAFLNWGGYAYTSDEFGVDARAEFAEALRTTQIAVKNQDNREHDIYDSDDYMQFHGGMIAAVRHISGRAPKAYFGDSSDPSRNIVRDLQDESNRVFRSRVANPKWIESMTRHGYKGGLELAATVDYLFGYDATAGVLRDWQYEQVAQKYALDPHTHKFLQASNPWALQAILRRLLEAVERGMWQTDDEMKQRLQDELSKLGDDMEDWMDRAWQKSRGKR